MIWIDVIGIIHIKDVMAALSEGRDVDLSAIVRKPVYIPDTQSLGRMIVEMQTARAKSAIVLDDHGTAIGMAFLEDALEEIVGPIQDEFDDEELPSAATIRICIEMRGDVATARGRRAPGPRRKTAPTTRSAATWSPSWAGCRRKATTWTSGAIW